MFKDYVISITPMFAKKRGNYRGIVPKVGGANIFRNQPKNKAKLRHLYRSLVAGLITSSSFLSQSLFLPTVAAQTAAYCRFETDAIAQKESLRQASIKGNSKSQKSYQALVKEHAERLQQCRSQTWPGVQATWLRLYPCDANPGALDEIMDRIVNLGYNQVHVEVFYDGQVLLPAAENNTAWPSVVRSPGAERVDLLAQAIAKGHERGLRVYAWLFTMNFGYSYSQRPDRQSVLAKDGRGRSSLAAVEDGSQIFIDPYNQQAKRDYYQMVQALLRRRPDGILFDYIRYPRQSGSNSVVTQVQDLWIYGDGALQALYQRAMNQKGRELIQRYITKGFISADDVQAVDSLYPTEGSPLWQGRTPPTDELQMGIAQRRSMLQWDLWQLSVAHAAQGVIDFLALASYPAQQMRIPAGAVFFPEGNQVVGRGGYDSRLQPWNSFPSYIEWHPMSYALCNGASNCIANQVQNVLKAAQPSTVVAPVLAGIWGKNINDRPSLESQMRAIRQFAPQVNTVSHFAYSWQEAESDRERKFCKL